MVLTVAFTAEHIRSTQASPNVRVDTGWIDPEYSRKELSQDRNDVKTFPFDTLEEAEEFIKETIGEYEAPEDGSYYALYGGQDVETGDYWSYAAHISEH